MFVAQQRDGKVVMYKHPIHSIECVIRSECVLSEMGKKFEALQEEEQQDDEELLMGTCKNN